MVNDSTNSVILGVETHETASKQEATNNKSPLMEHIKDCLVVINNIHSQKKITELDKNMAVGLMAICFVYLELYTEKNLIDRLRKCRNGLVHRTLYARKAPDLPEFTSVFIEFLQECIEKANSGRPIIFTEFSVIDKLSNTKMYKEITKRSTIYPEEPEIISDQIKKECTNLQQNVDILGHEGHEVSLPHIGAVFTSIMIVSELWQKLIKQVGEMLKDNFNHTIETIRNGLAHICSTNTKKGPGFYTNGNKGLDHLLLLKEAKKIISGWNKAEQALMEFCTSHQTDKVPTGSNVEEPSSPPPNAVSLKKC